MKDRFLIIARDLGTIAMMIIIILSFSSSFFRKVIEWGIALPPRKDQLPS